MNSSFRRCLVLVMALVATPLARAELEFVGVLATSQSTRFALTDTETGRTDWVESDGQFAGYTVKTYEPGADLLILVRPGAELRLRLKDDAKIKSARFELTGTITFGAEEKIEVTRATLLFDQENVFPLRDGITYRITPTRRSDGTIHYRMAVERMLAENRTERLSAPAVVTLPGQPFSLRMGDVGFSFTPR